jgi:hypothetical protein
MAKRRTRQTRKRKLRGGNISHYISKYNEQLDSIPSIEFIKQFPDTDQLTLILIFKRFIESGYQKIIDLQGRDDPVEVLFSKKSKLKEDYTNKRISQEDFETQNQELNKQIKQAQQKLDDDNKVFTDRAHKLNQQLVHLEDSLRNH